MSTPTEPFSPNTFVAFGDKHLSPPIIVDPNNPPWGVASAVFLWWGSLIVLLFLPLLFGLAYVAQIYGRVSLTLEAVARIADTDKTFVFVSIIALLPVHIITFALAWAVVTGFGRRPFWASIGWSWSPNFGLWSSVGVALALFVIGYGLIVLTNGEKTDLDRIIENSVPTRFAMAFLATATAPLVEEVVYRGVLFSALQRAMQNRGVNLILSALQLVMRKLFRVVLPPPAVMLSPSLQRTTGTTLAVAGVIVLFTLVHVPQYDDNLTVIAVLAVLSLVLTVVRAVTGRLLPCFVIHFVFNGIQSVLIVLAPYLPQPPTVDDGATPSLIVLFINSACAFRVFV